MPEALLYKDAVFKSQWGQSNSPWAIKRISHPEGWSMILMANTYYNFSFANADHLTNVSFDSVLYHFDVSIILILSLCLPNQICIQQPIARSTVV